MPHNPTHPLRITTLEEDWQSFRAMLVNVGIKNPVQLHEMNKAFVAGYWVAFNKITNSLATHTDDSAMLHLTQLQNELDRIEANLFRGGDQAQAQARRN